MEDSSAAPARATSSRCTAFMASSFAQRDEADAAIAGQADGIQCQAATSRQVTGVFMLGLLLEEVVADAAFVALFFDRRDAQLGRCLLSCLPRRVSRRDRDAANARMGEDVDSGVGARRAGGGLCHWRSPSAAREEIGNSPVARAAHH